MNREELLQVIEDAVKNETTELDLGITGLKRLPPEIGQLTSLTALNLNNTQLRGLPLEIGQLASLTTLLLSNTSLSELPLEIIQLSNLTELDLSHNKLSELPPEIGQLTNLTRLDLSSNRLSELPPEIGQLTSLTTLNLSSNSLSELPPQISQLINLISLDLGNALPDWLLRVQKEQDGYEFMQNRGNYFTSLPPEIGQLTNLTSLNLGYNCLSELPPKIGQLTSLTTLYLNDNSLSELPSEIGQLSNLITLDLRYNHLNQLPSEIGQLSNLTSLDLSENPLETPPLEVAVKGVEAIAQYFEQIAQEGTAYLYEAKLLIVGEGGAGKTTLTKKIRNSNYELPAYQASTEGIDILPWRFPLPSEQTQASEQEFQVNIWDFGGQEIYHATHQFFLTKRSLYVLVADNRKEHTDLYYWLNVVELLSDNSPLLIVQNEKDDRSVEINSRELRGHFDNLKETLPTNLKTNRGLADILHHLKHHLTALPHIGDKIPTTWLKVREALEANDQDYISLAEYRALCRDNGLERTQDQDQLSGYLHDLGVCLHFHDDIFLKRTVILKPTWGTDAVYRVLDNEGIKKNLGRFSQDDLDLIWAEEKYAAKQPELLQLMIKFKLCYPLPNQDRWYIAPQLLTKNQPGYDWDEANNLLLRYEYKFMPKGIMTRFIVVMHPYIETQPHVWQSGVILAKDETRAEVIEYYDRREITIRIAGRHKRDLMTAIAFELDRIHDSYPRLNVSKLVPCNCPACKDSQKPHFYNFENLRRRLLKGKRTVECEISYEDVSVQGLLDDIGRPAIASLSPREEELQVLIINHRRRLQKLKEQQSKSGNATPPEILNEIEDIEAELERLQAALDGLV